MSGQSLSSLASKLEQSWGGGGVLAYREPLVVPRSTQKPWRSQGLWAGRARRRKEGQSGGPPAQAHVSLFCFVLSGPRLRLWQKESREPTKVSSPVSWMGSLNSPRVG